ncbi:MAG: hypothetical protein U0P81_15225 [Holophagaceae bacterium]
MIRSLSLALGLLAAGVPTLAAAPAGPVAAPAGSPAMNPFQELFDLSMKEKKGLMFHLCGGQSVGGVVVKVGEHDVEVKNREYGRILIRLDRIDAVAMN